jgi:hypothetical protein
MTTVIAILITIIVASFIFALGITTDERIQRKIYGEFIPDSELEIFFRKHADDYINGTNDSDMLHGPIGFPYIAKISTGWTISKYGRVPKKSRFSKVIQGILDMKIKPKLSDL